MVNPPCNETVLELVAATLQHKETEALRQGCPAEMKLMNAVFHSSLSHSVRSQKQEPQLVERIDDN